MLAERGSGEGADVIREHKRRPDIDDSLWLLKRGRREPPLFLVHGFDGSVTPYLRLAHNMRTARTVYCLQTCDRDGPAPVYAGIREMAAHYVEMLSRVQPEGPFSLGGFCFGGLVAFEMAQQLYAEGREVAVLALFDTFGPIYPRLTQRIPGHVGVMLRQTTKARLTYIWGRWKSLVRRIENAAPPGKAEQEGFVLLDPKYKPGRYPGRLSIFRAARQQQGFNPDPFSGWKGMAVKGLEVYDIPGDHLSILKEPCVRVLAEKLDSSLQ